MKDTEWESFVANFIRNQISHFKQPLEISLWRIGCSRNPQPALEFFNIYIFISYSSPFFRHFIPPVRRTEQNLDFHFVKSLIECFAMVFLSQFGLPCVNLETKYKIQSGYGKIKCSKGRGVLGLI